MSKVAKDIRVFVDQYDLSSAFKTAKPSGQVDSLESTTFGAIADKAYLNGLMKGALSLEGLFASDSVNQNQIDDVLSAALGSTSPHVVTVGQEGLIQAGRSILMSANETKYEVSSQVGQIIMSSAEFDSVYGYERGLMLHPLNAETATGSDTVADNAAASLNGGAAHLHVPAISGSGLSIVIKIQHSSDNITFVDLVTFTTIAAATPTSQRVEVTGTVNRYLKSTRTVSGSSPSASYAVAFARR
jgi:hypothetical protein